MATSVASASTSTAVEWATKPWHVSFCRNTDSSLKKMLWCLRIHTFITWFCFCTVICQKLAWTITVDILCCSCRWWLAFRDGLSGDAISGSVIVTPFFVSSSDPSWKVLGMCVRSSSAYNLGLVKVDYQSACLVLWPRMLASFVLLLCWLTCQSWAPNKQCRFICIVFGFTTDLLVARFLWCTGIAASSLLIFL